MKYKITKLTAALLMSASMIYAQNSITLEQAAREFYSNYDVSSYPIGKVDWEKRKDNWYVKAFKSIEPKIVMDKPVLFYDGIKGEFQKLDFPKAISSDTIDINTYIDDYSIYYFGIYPFFGYYKWYDDIISEYSNISNPTDEQMYLLGRAYSEKADAPIRNTDLYLPKAEMYQLDFKLNSIRKSDWEQYSKIQDSAIDLYKRLSERNPKFLTKVGPIGIKYSNEILTKFHALLTFSYDEALKSKILPGLYTDSLLRQCRSYLKSCPLNAILLTFGDNDFYPLLYLQKSENLRNDVHIINYNLLNVDNYIYRATQPQFESDGINIVNDKLLYTGRNNEMIYFVDSLTGIVMKDLIDTLTKAAREEKYRPVIKGNKISFHLKIKNPEAYDGTQAELPLENIPYLFKNQWILLNILHNLRGRKIAFVNGFFDELEKLNNFLTASGDVFLYDN